MDGTPTLCRTEFKWIKCEFTIADSERMVLTSSYGLRSWLYFTIEDGGNNDSARSNDCWCALPTHDTQKSKQHPQDSATSSKARRINSK